MMTVNNRTIRITAILITLALVVPASASARPKAAKPADYAEKAQSWNQHQRMEQSSLYRNLDWRSIGPVIQGGRLVDIAVHPDNPYTFYVAYASGGLWKTSDNGVNFTPLFDQQASMIMGDIAIDPNQPDTLWVGTGENNSSRSSYGGMGVYRSTDGGVSWSHMGLGETDRIGAIVVDPDNSDRVLVAALGRLYTDGGDRGIYLTEDGGSSWQQVLAGDGWTGFIDLVFKPGDFSTLYAASWERSRTPWNFVEGGEGSAIWRSTDGGRNWTRLNGGFPSGGHVGRIGLAVSPDSPDTLYASVDNQKPLPQSEWDMGDRPVNAKRLRNMSKEQFLMQDTDEVEAFIRSSDLPVDVNAQSLMDMIRSGEMTLRDLLDELNDANANLFNNDIESLQVWRSDDGGDSWRKTHDKPLQQVVFSYGYYFGEIRVSPSDINRVYALGVPIITSDDGGRSWQSIHGRGVHVDYQSMWVNPEFSDHLVVGNDGGLDASFDGGKSWVKIDSQPLGQFYTVNVDMATPYNVFGGLQDNGTIRCPSTNDWTRGEGCRRINGGDGMYVAVDPRDNKTVYTGYQFGNYVRIDPDNSRNEVRPRDAIGESALRYNWNSPVILSPHNADIVYFGANRLYRSMDKGANWTALSEDLTRADERGDVPFATLTSVDESPLAFGLIWVGTDDGQVWVTEDSGSNWRNVARRLPQERWVSRVEASPHKRDTAYVTLNGYRNDDITSYVYRTRNLGRDWQSISDGLPAEAVNVIVADPVVDGLLYVGTDRGVYVSSDDGDTWQSLQAGLPNVPVHDLVVHPRDRELVAGTHGRSFWVLDVLPVQELALTDSDQPQLFPVEDVQASRGWRSRPSRWYGHLQTPPEVEISYHAHEDGTMEISIIDAEDNTVASFNHAVTRGPGATSWGLLVDAETVIAAEKAAYDALDPEQQSLAQLGYSESRRLGHPLLARPGDYTVRIKLGDASAERGFEVKAPAAYTPRTKPKFTLRGRK